MPVVGQVKQFGDEALSLTLLSIPINKLHHILNTMKGNRNPDPKKTGVPTAFIKAWSMANVMAGTNVKTAHRDSYQFDEEDNLLMHSGRVFRPNQQLELDQLLYALAVNIVENTLECFYTGQLDELTELALTTSDGLAQEKALLSMHNWLFIMSSVQMMKLTFETLLRNKLHIQIDVWFDKASAKDYHAYIDGKNMNPKVRARRLMKQIRTIQADVLGFADGPVQA